MTKAKASRTRGSAKPVRQACDACHFKKIRCLRGPGGGDGPCQRCSREGVACVFSPALKTGRPRKAAAGRRPDTESTSGQSSAPAVPESPYFPRVPDLHGSPSVAGTLAFPLNSLDAGIIDLVPVRYPLVLENTVTAVGDPETTQVQVLAKLELLSAFQQQLVAKRREHAAVFSHRRRVDASHAIHELLQIAQKVTDWSTWLMIRGARFAWRTPMLESMSDETALMMVVSPATLVLEVFADVLGTAFPSLKDSASSGSETAVSDDEGALWAINPALLSKSTPAVPHPATTTVLPDVGAVQDLANPVCVYMLLTALQEQVDAMRNAVDECLAAFPRMNSALGAQGLLPAIVDQYLEKIRSVQAYITRAGGDNLMAGLN